MSIILKKARKDFKKLGWRSVLMIMVIALSLGGALALLYAVDAANPMIDNYYDDADHADYTYQLGETSWISQSELDELKNLEEIKSYTGRLFWTTSIKLEGEDDYKYLLLIGLDGTIDEPEVYKYSIESGKNFNEDGSKISAIVDKTFAEKNHIDPNDELEITGMCDSTVKITGTFTSPEFLSMTSNPEIFLPLEGSMGIMYLSKDTLKAYIKDYLIWYNSTIPTDITPLIWYYSSKDYNNLAVIFDGDIEEGNDVVTDYLEKDCAVTIESSETIEDSYAYSSLKKNISESVEFMFIILLFMIFMGVLIVFVIFNRYVLAQKQQLGVLEAIGYTKRDLIYYFTFNITIIALISIPLGIIIGYSLGYTLIGELLSQMANINLADIGYVSLPHIAYFGLIIGVGMLVLSTFLPIHKIRKKEISDLIYMQTDIDYKIKSKKHLKKTQITKKESVTDKLVLHNVIKNKKRLILTVGAIACSLLIVSAGQTILDSIFYNIDRTFNNSGTIDDPTEAWDFDVHFQNPINISIQESDIDAIKEINGVERGEIYSKGLVTANNDGKEETFLLYGLNWKKTEMHNFKWKDDTQDNSIPEKDSEIVISSVYAARLNKGIGDKIKIENPDTQSFTFKIVGIHNELVVCCYITKEAADSVFHGGQDFADGIYLLLDDSENKRDVKKNVYEEPNIAIILDSKEMGTKMNTYIMDYFMIFQIIVNYTLVVAYFIILYNSIMNIYDKNYEYGILRSLGFSKSKIFKYILVENILQGLLPITIALIFTYPLSTYIASIYEEQFPILVYLGTSTILIIVLPVIGLSILGSIVGHRTVFKQNLYEQVQTSFVG